MEKTMFKSILALALCCFASHSFAQPVPRPIQPHPIPVPNPEQPDTTAGTITFQFSDNLNTANMNYGVTTSRSNGKLSQMLEVSGSAGVVDFMPQGGKSEEVKANRWSRVVVLLEDSAANPEANSWMNQFNSCITNFTKGPEIPDAYKKRSATFSISFHLSAPAYNTMVKTLKEQIAGAGFGINPVLRTNEIDSLNCNTFVIIPAFVP